MMKSEYEFWKDYRNGKINRELTSDEQKEIRASDFAMHLLIPTDILLQEVGGFDNLVKIASNLEVETIECLAQKFRVEPTMMSIKIAYLVNNSSTENKTLKKTSKKIFKKIINNL